MAQQLTFDLAMRPARGRDAFFVSPSNALALSLVEAWPAWPEGRLVIAGPQGAGKSHLAAVWAQVSQANLVQAARLISAEIPGLTQGHLVVEDVQEAGPEAQTALFHLLNLARAEGRSVLLTTRAPMAGLGLRDLRSRLEAATSVTLSPPDDALLGALLVKLFGDRQLHVAPNLIPYLVDRIERSHAAAQDIVARLDALALERKAPLTRDLARHILSPGP